MKRLAAINLSLALVFSFLSVAWGTAIYTGNWAGPPHTMIYELISTPAVYSERLVTESIQYYADTGGSDMGGFMKSFDEPTMRSELVVRAVDGADKNRENYPYIPTPALQYSLGISLVDLGMSSEQTYTALSVFWALLTAICLAFMAIWVGRETRPEAGVFLMGLYLLMPSLWERAASVYWSTAADLLPILATMFLFPKTKPLEVGRAVVWVLAIFTTFTLKFQTGYEFLSCITIAAWLPAVWYTFHAPEINRSERVKTFIFSGLCVALTAFSAFIFSVFLHVNKIAGVFGGDMKLARDAFMSVILYSTSGDDALQVAEVGRSLKAVSENLAKVVARNLHVNFVLAGGVFLTAWMAWRTPVDAQRTRDTKTLIAITFLASVGVASWYILAQEHAMRHPHVIWFLLPVMIYPWCVMLLAQLYTQARRRREIHKMAAF